jgi:hypothetical protein
MGPAAALADPRQFAKLLHRLHRHECVVYAKPAFGGPIQGLRYLGRYTHRVAISNHRLLAFNHERVTFRWKDYAHGGKQGQMTLMATEFLRRFFLHVLPKGFVRIRHFGFLTNRFRATRLALGRQLLASSSAPEERVGTYDVCFGKCWSLALPTLWRTWGACRFGRHSLGIGFWNVIQRGRLQYRSEFNGCRIRAGCQRPRARILRIRFGLWAIFD